MIGKYEMENKARKSRRSQSHREKDDEGIQIAKANLESGTCRMWNGDVFHGTAIMYAARDGDFMPVQCDYELGTLSETRPKEVRAYRQSLKRRGLKRPRLRPDQLHSEVVVIFGPVMSTKKAVDALQFLVRRITKEGLLTGRDHSEEYVVETVSGDLKV